MTEPSVPDPLEKRLSNTFSARVADVRAESDLLAAAGDRTTQRRRRTTGTVVMIAAAAAVAAVAVTAAFGSGGDRAGPTASTSPTPTTSSSDSSPTGLAPDTLTVALNGVAVSVPDTWSIVKDDDECAPVQLDRTIVATGLCQDGRTGQLGTSVVLASLDSPDGRDAQSRMEEVSDGVVGGGTKEINDLTVESTGASCAQSGKSTPICSIDLVARDPGVVVRINAASFDAVEEIAATVGSVPEGYTVVPDLGDLGRDLPPVNYVVDELTRAGLVVVDTSSGYAIAIDPAPATVVPQGSEVTLTTTVNRKGPPPVATSDQVDGAWLVQVVGVADIDGPPPTMSLHGGQMSADDGCNQIGGQYTTAGEDLVFDNDSIESTQVACDLTTAFLERLRRVRHLTFEPDGLYLNADNGEIILVLRRP